MITTNERIEALPDVMEATDIKNFLGLSNGSTYSLLKEKQFHYIKAGSLYKIPKESFVKWYLGA